MSAFPGSGGSAASRTETDDDDDDDEEEAVPLATESAHLSQPETFQAGRNTWWIVAFLCAITIAIIHVNANRGAIAWASFPTPRIALRESTASQGMASVSPFESASQTLAASRSVAQSSTPSPSAEASSSASGSPTAAAAASSSVSWTASITVSRTSSTTVSPAASASVSCSAFSSVSSSASPSPLIVTREPACNFQRLYGVASEGRGHTIWTTRVDDTTGKASLELYATAAHCDPSRLAYEDVVGALRGHHLLISGDSVTRYQYLSLVYFIETGRWASPEPSMVREKDWVSAGDRGSGWLNFFGGTNSRLNGREICDCFRTEPWDPQNPMENRYYISADASIRVTFINWFHLFASHGHDLDALNEKCLADAFGEYQRSKQLQVNTTCEQKLCLPGACSGMDWSGNPFESIPIMAGKLQPSIMLVNSGIWQGFPRPGSQDVADTVKMFQRFREEVPSSRLFWKTVTTTRDLNLTGTDLLGNPAADPVVAALTAAMPSDVEVFDARTLTYGVLTAPEAAFWPGDGIHFSEPVYALLNTALLSQLAQARVPGLQ